MHILQVWQQIIFQVVGVKGKSNDFDWWWVGAVMIDQICAQPKVLSVQAATLPWSCQQSCHHAFNQNSDNNIGDHANELKNWLSKKMQSVQVYNFWTSLRLSNHSTTCTMFSTFVKKNVNAKKKGKDFVRAIALFHQLVLQFPLCLSFKYFWFKFPTISNFWYFILHLGNPTLVAQLDDLFSWYCIHMYMVYQY